jgi:hypothetical protein
MIVQITGTTGGLSPYDIFLCDSTLTGCFYVSGVTNIPTTVIINTESYFPNETFLYIKIVDSNGCVYLNNIDCSVQKIFQDGVLFDFMDGVPYMFQ